MVEVVVGLALLTLLVVVVVEEQVMVQHMELVTKDIMEEVHIIQPLLTLEEEAEELEQSEEIAQQVLMALVVLD